MLIYKRFNNVKVVQKIDAKPRSYSEFYLLPIKPSIHLAVFIFLTEGLIEAGL